MKYTSTRGGDGDVDFEGVLFSGFAPDGGLFMPKEIPRLDGDTLLKWSSFSYEDLVKEVCSLFIPSELIPKEDLDDLIGKAFSRFRHSDVVNLCRLKNGLNVLEMWHGVTHAFKDLAMSCVGQFLQYFLKKQNKHVTILVGTSGDTGSSAIESVRGMRDVDIVVLLPRGRCTQIQELQMTTVIEDNVHVFAVEGTSDDLDVPIKKLFADTEFVRRHNLMSLNSVNWARIMVQIAHFFYAYFQCTPAMRNEEPLPIVEVIVPTGGAGNLTAGCIAQRMRLPIQLVAGVNKNDIIHRTIQHGDFSLRDTVLSTLASAMDIQEPYNMERIFWLLADSDCSLVKKLMEEFQKNKTCKVPEKLHAKITEVLTSYSASDEDIIQTMRRCWVEDHYLLCPHSAVAVLYHYMMSDCHRTSPRCCLAPASAAKFQDVLLRANLTPEIPPEIKALEAMETRFTLLKREDDWDQVLRDKIESIYQQRKV
ncbi:threonine synthase-like 2 [Rhinatrema bivittatum]|uniref:threonine synthase-like 2 n=1 Tax=Rhinatrema bivittatum TaxID=194408 RepID=UPI001126BE7B|nr:threonine synthase-like 2 [Rhinatrema bivittatum]XP_029448956.1 threonine synthase-like 2 [Rhinatrema bivittatum]